MNGPGLGRSGRRPKSLRWRVVRAALRLPAAGRPRFVRHVCAQRGEPDVAARALTDLRDLDDETGPALDAPLLGALGPLPEAPRTLPADPLALMNRVIARRYVVCGVLGSGGSGVVVEAVDRRSGRPGERGGERRVALKLFVRGTALEDDAWRREVAVLRGLALPGVVPLLDDGEDGEWAYLVMPRLVGGPFPGRAAPVAWGEVKGPAVGLLETLARIHAHGVVHRDLKPANAWVDADGTTTLLDVGASGGPEGHSPSAVVAGTWAWMSPEQRAGRDVDPRSDLYTFGLLLATALSGRPPQTHADDARRGRSARSHLPAVPADVVGAIDRLLADDPAARPGDALEALRLLRGRYESRWAVAGFSERDPTARREEDLRALFLGHDRLHHLREDAARELFLRTRGFPAAVVAELASWERAGLARREGERFVVTRPALARLADGAAFPLALAPPLPPDGPAAAASPKSPASPTSPASPGASEDDAHLDELLSAAVWAGPGADADLLARATRGPAREVTRRLAHLRALGRLVTLDGDRHLPVGPVPAARWPRERQWALRRRLVDALPPGAPGRIWNVAVVGSAVEIVDEALARPRADVPGLAAGLSSALRHARHAMVDDARLDRLLRARLDASLSLNDARELEDALRETDLLRRPAGTRAIVRMLGRAALAAIRGDPQAATDLLDELDLPDDDPSAKDAHRIRLRAARALGRAAEERAVAAAAAWASRRHDAVTGGAVKDWLAWHAYAAGRYADAAERHEERAREAEHPLVRVQALANAAVSWIDAGDLPRARRTAERGLAALGTRRAPVFEATLTLAQRAADHRSGAPLAPDLELADAAEALGVASVAGHLLLTEAALAYRAGDGPTATALARRSATRWRASGGADPPGALLADALAMASSLPGAPADGDDPTERLVGRALACPLPAIRAQALALLCRARPPLRTRLRGPIAEAVRLAADADRSRALYERREVLSLSEAEAETADAPPPRHGRPPLDR